MSWHGGNHMFGYGWIMMVILTIMILAGFAAIMFALVRGRRDIPMTNGSHPLHLLDERLARGEVDIDEYQRRRAILVEHPGL